MKKGFRVLTREEAADVFAKGGGSSSSSSSSSSSGSSSTSGSKSSGSSSPSSGSGSSSSTSGRKGSGGSRSPPPSGGSGTAVPAPTPVSTPPSGGSGIMVPSPTIDPLYAPTTPPVSTTRTVGPNDGFGLELTPNGGKTTIIVGGNGSIDNDSPYVHVTDGYVGMRFVL